MDFRQYLEIIILSQKIHGFIDICQIIISYSLWPKDSL